MAGLLAHFFGALSTEGHRRADIPTHKPITPPAATTPAVPTTRRTLPGRPAATTLLTGASGLASNQPVTGKTLLGQ